MRHDPNTYLWDIQQAAQRINSLTAETTFDEYNGDWQVSLLVERLFIIIGETTVIPALAGIQKGRRGANLTTIPQIIGFRIVLVHRYPEIRNQRSLGNYPAKTPNPPQRSHQPPRITLNRNLPFAKRKGTRASVAMLVGDARPDSHCPVIPANTHVIPAQAGIQRSREAVVSPSPSMGED